MKLLLVLFTFFSLQIASAKNIHLTTYNVCTLDSQVDGTSMRALKTCLDDKVAQRAWRSYPIYLYINSGGGSIYHGLRFISFAKSVRNLHTITEFSASMAAAIAQGLPGKRYVLDHGTFMFHRARGGFRGQFEDGELESRLKLWKTIVRKMESMQAKRIGITLKQYKKKRFNEWWIYGDDNVKQNTADAVISATCSSKLSKKKEKKTVRSFFGARTIEKSSCPLVQ